MILRGKFSIVHLQLYISRLKLKDDLPVQSLSEPHCPDFEPRKSNAHCFRWYESPRCTKPDEPRSVSPIRVVHSTISAGGVSAEHTNGCGLTNRRFESWYRAVDV